MFTKVLIANRGEIAVRVIRTLERMGIASVAVYSDADHAAPHVALASEAVRIGPPPPRESYANTDAILAAARNTRAEAIHPGYGFLAEDVGFAQLCEAAGIRFIGATVPSLRAASPIEVITQSTGRHIDVQVFGDGEGAVIVLGERDCSLQRRSQPILAESPAPQVSQKLRESLFDASRRTAEEAQLFGVGSVAFLVEGDTLHPLGLTSRLQVEHRVAELVTGIDLVEWSLRLAAGDRSMFDEPVPTPRGHALQVRIYAENPARHFRPNGGTLTAASFAFDMADVGIAAGDTVPQVYDPLLAVAAVHAATRPAALAKLSTSLGNTTLAGVETTLDFLRQLVASPVLAAGDYDTHSLATITPRAHTIDVLTAGHFTTVQDYPGRVGYWDVGVPPCGPMDHLSFRLGNRLLGNDEGAAGLEFTLTGPTIRFNCSTTICLTGAVMAATVDGDPVPYYQPIRVLAGSTLKMGSLTGPGVRTYLLVRGGLDVPEYLGSKSTFTLGNFGGHGGRTLRAGDVLHLPVVAVDSAPVRPLDPALVPHLTHDWRVGVMYGPHGAPDFFTRTDIQALFAAEWKVHFNSARSGVRLVGPKPQWARTDGGEAGLHPSNIHDNAYAIGAVDFTGDMPVILGPDGPSLGGFVCPLTVVQSELWKIGQLKPGDTLRFTPMAPDQAMEASRVQNRRVSLLTPAAGWPRHAPARSQIAAGLADAVIFRGNLGGNGCEFAVRPAGDHYLLVEFGPNVLDLDLRFRAHALQERIVAEHIDGLIDLTPGIRSLQLHFDPIRISQRALLDLLKVVIRELPPIDDVEVPTRIVHLPLSWDDPAIHQTIRRYMTGVRNDAPWCPSNIEFIRRINGLSSIDEVHRIVFDASYLVMGLGDVYLGAPVATPIDPRHRLVTTKYNPARTWTPPNVVGIGGAYMCIYGMEGPGGYQLFGRTIQVWNTHRQTGDFTHSKPWLLRFFDQVRFFPVSHGELTKLREEFPLGRYKLKVEEETFRLRDYHRFLESIKDDAAAFKTRQQAAFDAERQRWAQAGEFGTLK